MLILSALRGAYIAGRWVCLNDEAVNTVNMADIHRQSNTALDMQDCQRLCFGFIYVLLQS